MSNMAQSGFTTGMVSGGLVGLGIVASKAVDHAIEHQRALGTVQRWSLALDQQKRRATKAERNAARLSSENEALRQALADMRFELDILRNA